MFEETGAFRQADDAGQEAQQQQNQQFQEEDVYIPSEDEDGTGITFDDDFEQPLRNNEANDEDQGLSFEDEELERINKENQEGLNFDDDVVKKQQSQQEETSAEDMIEKLKELGYNVEKDSNEPQQDPRIAELEQHNTQIDNLEHFLEQDDKAVITEKERNNLIEMYKREGREHLIGTESFNDDLEANVEDIMDDSRYSKMYADNVKRDVREFLSKKTTERDSVQNAITKDQNNKLAENRRGLQDSFTHFHKEGFLGIKPTEEDVKGAYKDITSRALSKELNQNPKLVAEFALFQRMKAKLESSYGGATYGEGVRDTIDKLNGNQGTRSSLAKGLNSRSSSSGNEVRDIANRFRDESQNNSKDNYVAGAGGFF